MISKGKLIYFMSFSNILLINVIGFSSFCNNYGNLAWLYLIIYIIFITFLSLFFKGFPNSFNLLKNIKKKFFLRIIIIVYLVIMTSILLIIGSVIIKKFFYFNAYLFVILVILLFTAIIICSRGIKCLVDIGFISFLLMTFFYLVPIFHSSERDFSFLLPLGFDASILYKSFLLIIFPLENILFVLEHDSIKNGFSRSIFTLSSVGCGVYLLIIIIDSITLTGVNFYNDLRYGGLYHWQLFQGDEFIENYDFLLLIILTVSTIFRLSFYIETIKKLTFLKKSKILSLAILVLFSIIGYILYLFINHLTNIVIFLMIICFILIITIYVVFCILSRKKNKELITNE